jgi:hypothetical protein
LYAPSSRRQDHGFGTCRTSGPLLSWLLTPRGAGRSCQNRSRPQRSPRSWAELLVPPHPTSGNEHARSHRRHTGKARTCQNSCCSAGDPPWPFAFATGRAPAHCLSAPPDMLHRSRCSVRRRPPPRHIPRGREQLACSPGFLATQRPTRALRTGAAGARAQSPIWAISHFRSARRHSAAATLSRTRARRPAPGSTQPCRRVRAPQAPCARAMRSCRWGGIRRASGREMGSGAARVGGADPGARGGRTRGTFQRRTGCTGSAPRCAARPIHPHPRRPPPSALDFHPFFILIFSDLRAILTAPHPVTSWKRSRAHQFPYKSGVSWT